MINFVGIKYFRPDSSDAWGDPSQISAELLQLLDKLRALTKRPIHVTSGFRANSKDSQHALGLAVDVVCPDMDLLDFYLTAERLAFTGIGVYPNWKYSGTVVGGLHLDIRKNGPARWMGVQIGATEQTYVSLDKKNLQLYGVLD